MKAQSSGAQVRAPLLIYKKTSEAPYTTKLNYRVHTSRGTTRGLPQILLVCV